MRVKRADDGINLWIVNEGAILARDEARSLALNILAMCEE